MDKIAICGVKEKGIRSDCLVTLNLTDKDRLNILVKSKVEIFYGKSIYKLAEDILHFFNITSAELLIEDSGALPYVIAARIEACIKKLINTDKEFLIPIISTNKSFTSREKDRISRLYLPGNAPSYFINAGIHNPDGIILDLEDSVAPDKKFEASFLVRNALRNVNFNGSERMVRINQVPLGLDDLDFIVPNNVNLILIPKTETSEQILKVKNKIDLIKAKYNINNSIWLMPIIESALGVVNAYDIAASDDTIVAIAIGLEDYTADLGTKRTAEGNESFFARSTIVNACRAAGIQAIDSVFSDVSDMEALTKNVKISKSLGFEGMGCIHPRQIKVIHNAYAPDEEEIEKAKKIVLAFIEAEKKGLGVVSLGSKMIDPPVVKRAQKVIETAIKAGKLSINWRTENE